MKYLVNIDLSQNELQNARIQNLAAAPENAVKGQIYFNTASNKYFGYNGTKWVDLGYEHPSTHTIAEISGLQSALNAKSDKTHDHNGTYKPASYVPTWNEVTGKPSTFTPATHSHSEYVNKNAFGNVKVGSTTIAADAVQDTLELAAGSNIVLTPDATNDKVTIAVNGLTVSQSEKDTWNAKETPANAQSKANAALASAKTYADEKVAALVNGAPETLDTLNELATAIGENKAGVTDLLTAVGTKVAPTGTIVANRIAIFNDTTGKVIKDSGFTIATSVPSGAKFTDTTYSAATTSANGLMTSAMVTKLNGIATNANNYSHPTGDGNLHVPATGTSNNKKFLMAGSTAGSLAWTAITASHITQDSSNRFITDAERTAWNAKSNLALGTTSSTAYRGDHGLAAYNHSLAAHAPSNAQKNSDITKAEIEAKLTGTITSHNHSGTYSPVNHNHNGTYMRRYAANIGDGSSTTIKVTHNLGSEDVTIAVREVSTKQIVMVDTQIVDSNSIQILFASAPTSGQYRVVVIG